LDDVLLFQKPIEKAMFLRLELPGAALQGTGTGYFEIPISMLVKTPVPKEPLPAAKAASAEKTAAAGKKEGAGASPGSVPELDLTRQEDGPGRTPATKPPASEGAFGKLTEP
jgi:hypothetical protein